MAVTTFLTPCTMSVVGISGAGKTSLVRRLLRYRDVMFDSHFTSITYFYTIWQSVYGEMEEEFGTLIRFIEGLPGEGDVKQIGETEGHKCIILDDLMAAVSNNARMEDLFSRESHHYSISVLYISQNAFRQGKSSRSIALNVHYTILMSNPRVSQVMTLGHQFGIGKALKEAFLDATSKKRFSYLILLASPRDASGFSMITHVFPDETEPITVYEPLF